MKGNFLRFYALWLEFLLFSKMQVSIESFCLYKVFASKLYEKLTLYSSLPYEVSLTESCY